MSQPLRPKVSMITRISRLLGLTTEHSLKETPMSTKVLVLYYSTYGHTETMAQAIAEGARSAGTEVSLKRVPELMSEEVARQAGANLEQRADIATPGELVDYDAIIIGTPTRFGRVSSQMANFLDQTGGLWAEGKLIGKVGGAFVSTPHR